MYMFLCYSFFGFFHDEGNHSCKGRAIRSGVFNVFVENRIGVISST